MNLLIETDDKSRAGDIENAYVIALNETNKQDFINSLKQNIGNTIIGEGGNHIFITDKTSLKRLAIIERPFN